MLENMYASILDRYNDPLSSWDKLVEFLAVDYNGLLIKDMRHNFEWLYKDKEFTNKIIGLFDFELLQSDYHDHLGDMYLEKFLIKEVAIKRGQDLFSTKQGSLLSRPKADKHERQFGVLDPNVGTGRNLMAIHKLKPGYLLYGADKDLRLLRIAMTNFSIHDITGHLLHADKRVHEIDLAKENGKYNWQFANRWHSHMDKLRPISESNYVPLP